MRVEYAGLRGVIWWLEGVDCGGDEGRNAGFSGEVW